MTDEDAVYSESERVHREPAVNSPHRGIFILSEVAAFGQQGFMRCLA